MDTEITRLREDQNGWNILLSAFFIVMLCFGLLLIYTVRGSLPHEISLFDAVLLALAAFRITRLIVYDKITRFFREWFVYKYDDVREGKEVTIILPYQVGLRRTLHDLVNCPWCIGIWGTLIIVVIYYVFPFGWLITFILAIAGVASFMQMLANLIGWSAEYMKGKTHADFH
jgi:hypothetical protein